MVLLITSINTNAQTRADVIRIEFNTGTRGYTEHAVITPDSLVVRVEDFRAEVSPEKKSCLLKNNEWKQLVKTLDGISIPTVQQFKSPTNNRAFDGAKHSSIIITTSNGKSVEHSFDDDNPHEKLKPLMVKIRKMINHK